MANTINIPREEVSKLLLFDYFNKRQKYLEKTIIFERKYDLTFKEFEASVRDKEENDQVDLQEWEDYIEWQSYNQMIAKLDNLIRAVKSGNYTIAD